MKLSELKPTETAVIKKINCEKPLKNRLSHLGVIEGAKIKFIKVSPFSDPIEIMVRGFYLAIRLETAEQIDVEKI